MRKVINIRATDNVLHLFGIMNIARVWMDGFRDTGRISLLLLLIYSLRMSSPNITKWLQVILKLTFCILPWNGHGDPWWPSLNCGQCHWKGEGHSTYDKVWRPRPGSDLQSLHCSGSQWKNHGSKPAGLSAAATQSVIVGGDKASCFTGADNTETHLQVLCTRKK